jgi:hypothetical protein
VLSAYTAELGHTGWLEQVHINGTSARMASLSCCLERFGQDCCNVRAANWCTGPNACTQVLNVLAGVVASHIRAQLEEIIIGQSEAHTCVQEARLCVLGTCATLAPQGEGMLPNRQTGATVCLAGTWQPALYGAADCF